MERLRLRQVRELLQSHTEGTRRWDTGPVPTGSTPCFQPVTKLVTTLSECFFYARHQTLPFTRKRFSLSYHRHWGSLGTVCNSSIPSCNRLCHILCQGTKMLQDVVPCPVLVDLGCVTRFDQRAVGEYDVNRGLKCACEVCLGLFCQENSTVPRTYQPQT